MELATLIAFAAAFFVFAASPGPDNMTIVARTITHGAASGLAYGAGTVAGILIFLTLAAFGLSILAAEMGTVMAVLRYGGAAYLIWMGFKLWTAEPVVPDLQPMNGRHSLLSIFATGTALNLGNPKMPLFLSGIATERCRRLADGRSPSGADIRHRRGGGGCDRRSCGSGCAGKAAA